MDIASHFTILDATIAPLEALPSLPPALCTPVFQFYAAQLVHGGRDCWAHVDAATRQDQGPCFHLMEELTLSGDARALDGSVGNLLSIRTERI